MSISANLDEEEGHESQEASDTMSPIIYYPSSMVMQQQERQLEGTSDYISQLDISNQTLLELEHIADSQVLPLESTAPSVPVQITAQQELQLAVLPARGTEIQKDDEKDEDYNPPSNFIKINKDTMVFTQSERAGKELDEDSVTKLLFKLRDKQQVNRSIIYDTFSRFEIIKLLRHAKCEIGAESDTTELSRQLSKQCRNGTYKSTLHSIKSQPIQSIESNSKSSNSTLKDVASQQPTQLQTPIIQQNSSQFLPVNENARLQSTSKTPLSIPTLVLNTSDDSRKFISQENKQNTITSSFPQTQRLQLNKRGKGRGRKGNRDTSQTQLRIHSNNNPFQTQSVNASLTSSVNVTTISKAVEIAQVPITNLSSTAPNVVDMVETNLWKAVDTSK